ncbi:MAG TPA: HAD-IA family hydrolase, partial [Paracoccaceae bacterium]|nr:HAD-IA family hydrolase [Paracoccaceae bacterium]
DKVIADPARRAHFLGEVLTFEFHSRHDEGEELDVLVRELLARHPEYAAEVEAYTTRFNETISGPVAGVHELVGQMALRDVPLFALTNFGTTFWHGFHPTAPVFAQFRDIVVSGDEKLAKPDPAIFRLAEQRFGHAPHNLLFIDDRADNIAAARDRGWHGHLFTDAAALEAELTAHGLL